MSTKALNRSRADNPHIEAVQRIRQLAQILLRNPDEARAFWVKTGVFTEEGELKAPYR